MEVAPVWDQLSHSLSELPRSGLLLAALGAMLVGVIGSLMIRWIPSLGKMLRLASTLGLMGVLVLVVVQLSRMDPRFEMAVPQFGYPEQVVEGGETRVELARDGHFWLRGELNGHPASFLVDTGATLTAISTETAAVPATLASESSPEASKSASPLKPGRLLKSRTIAIIGSGSLCLRSGNEPHCSA